MKPPIDTSTPIESVHPVKNLTGVSSYSPASFSGSGETCTSAFELPSGRLPFALSRRLDLGKSPMVSGGLGVQKLELSTNPSIVLRGGASGVYITSPQSTSTG